jgi:DNA-binding MarR family transcriptional regulator
MDTSVTEQAGQALVTQWRELVARKARIWNALEQTLDRRHGLSTHEFEVLDQLSECTGDCQPRVQDIADVVPITQSALSRLIGRLEEQGLVERKLCDADRRGIFVGLTEAGRARHAEAKPTYIAVLGEEFARCDSADVQGRKLGLGEIVEARRIVTAAK